LRKFFSPDWWHERRADAAAVACIGLFFVAFFPQGLFGRKFLLVNDAFFYSYPMHTVAWRMLRHGELPLWTPYILSGYPLLSMTQLGLGYPLTWGHLFLPGYIAEQIYVLAPFLLAPAFTYLYLRMLGRSPLAALLAGLSFGYGGMMASPLGNSGMMTNAVMWLPPFLLAIERARTRRFAPCLLLATGAYTMSVLNGFGQGFLYVALLAVAYALFIALATDGQHAAGETTVQARLLSLRQWRPLLVACGAILLAAGVAAFQILETARVVRRSVRSELNYQIFAQGSFNPAELWRSIFEPLFYVIDMHAYMPPLALALAILAAYVHARRRQERDPRVFFWLAIALVAYVLMMGAFTPFYRIVYYLPLLNRFRVPSRHAFEWTFAIGVLAAYGWDAAAAMLRKRREARTRMLTLYAALALLACSILVGALWWLSVQAVPGGPSPGLTAPHGVYQLWKAAFVLLTLGALWRASQIAQARWRFSLLMACLLVICYVEPSALIARWWGGMGLPASRFSQQTEATRFLQQYPPAENRIYTRVDLMSEQFGDPPRFDSTNLSAVYGLHNVAGYEPLSFERYSRALGGAWLDAVHTVTAGAPDSSLFMARSHVLDILNTTFVVSYPNLATSLATPRAPRAATEMEVIGEVLPQTQRTLVVQPTDADALLFVTSLSNSTSEPDGQVVARVRVVMADGKVVERELQAGRDTAEWAHERPDVRPYIKHKLATPYDTVRVGGEKGYVAYRYKTLVKLDGAASVIRVEITNVSHTARLGIYGGVLLDSRTQRTVPLAAPYSQAWQPVYEQHETLILRNTRALPRAWLVAEAQAVDGEEALRRIRGESATEFDPRRTVLLEVRPEELPPLPGGTIAPASSARITSYEANRLRIETSAPGATMLVVSEVFYPGWVATVDSQPARINVADYLLRGIALPAGQHSVEMHYAAPAARNGAIISLLTLCLLAVLAAYARHTRH
jgi:hypothetical protein